MKSYKESLKEYYHGERLKQNIYTDKYSLLNPVGYRCYSKIIEKLHFLFNLIKKEYDFEKINVLDLGCGKGWFTRYMAEVLQDPKRVFGFDISEFRIEHARKMNPEISYINNDFLEIKEINRKFEMITAFDLFMHFKNADEIHKAMEKVDPLLTDTGIFIWYEPFAKDHFTSPDNADGWGFNPKQMDEFAKKINLKLKYEFSIFKIFYLKKAHSLYLIKKYPRWFLDLLELVLPGTPGNIMRIYQR
ncbi:MAG: hypothetical protein ACD_79C00252G0013 [uncultured bacterium]|nr:MAG: hypothetical protein ACD_79C00252G0013 [uncultured bacterium]